LIQRSKAHQNEIDNLKATLESKDFKLKYERVINLIILIIFYLHLSCSYSENSIRAVASRNSGQNRNGKERFIRRKSSLKGKKCLA
jgi:hypothetical protein